MDSAAAYSMTLPDEGTASWDGVPFAGRAVVSLSDGRYSFSVYAVSGSGTVVFDFGDGESRSVTFPDGTYRLEGEVVSDRSTPLFRHEYAADGSYEIRVSGNLTSIGLAGKHRPAGKDYSYSTSGTVIDGTSALHDIWHMSMSPEQHDMAGWGSVDTAVVDSSVLAWQLPWYEYEGDDVTELHDDSGPRKLVVRNLAGNRPIYAAYVYPWFPTVALRRLEEFWAPSVTEFGFAGSAGNPELNSITPFGFCDNMKIVYVPSLAKITKIAFVSPAAAGVKIYTGRLLSVNAEAFGNDRQENNGQLPEFVGSGHGSVELFCGNIRAEILGMPGYPFGARYLKCHCTDVTFDNQGGFWRSSDGRRVDSEGRLVDDQGRFVNEAGHLVKYHSGLGRWITCDEYGFYVDEDDRLYDPVTGFWTDRDGHVCDEHGRKSDTSGNLVDCKYWSPSDGWVAEDGTGTTKDYRLIQDGYSFQYVVDSTGVRLGTRDGTATGSYETGDPRLGTFVSELPSGDGSFDFYDGNGFLRAREVPVDGGGLAVYSVEYLGDREWSLSLYGGPLP